MEGTVQAAPYSENEVPNSSHGEGRFEQTYQQEPAARHPVHDRGQVLSRLTSRSSTTPTPPPDGGFAAWMCGMCEA